jgi:tetratricopeptide (TPR) repeat protein
MSCFAAALFAQGPPEGRGGPENETLHQGAQLDLEGKGTEARALFQKAIDTAPSAAAKANALRAMAMSWAFEGNCKKTAVYETQVIDYWKSREKDDPAHAFYQQGEMADEAARVCIENGDLNTAYAFYKQGRDLGLQEPDISPGRKDLWEFRWEHAQARIAARRGQKAEAEKHITAAKAVLADMKAKDASLFRQQTAFLSYLEGYVAFYTGDYKTALDHLQQANQRDPFIQCLMGMAYEKLGDETKAREAYQQAAQTRAHNPPAAFARPFASKKLLSNRPATPARSLGDFSSVLTKHRSAARLASS